MFTGIVQAVGSVVELISGRLQIGVRESFTDVRVGDSIAVNGVCLTLASEVELSKIRMAYQGSPAEVYSTLSFDLSEETLKRSALGRLGPGSQVNMESAATLQTVFGGHIVQGHVDCTGTIVKVKPQEHSTIIRFQAPPEYDRYLIDKGSITIDGISLTVVEPQDGVFDTWIIPHTLEHTNLRQRTPGDSVNLEFDVLAKHVEKLLAARSRLQ